MNKDSHDIRETISALIADLEYAQKRIDAELNVNFLVKLSNMIADLHELHDFFPSRYATIEHDDPADTIGELDFDFADATAQHLRKLGELVDRVLPQVIAQEARKRGKRYVVRKNYDVVYLKEFCFGVWDNKAQEWTGGVYTASQAQAECDRLNAAAAGGES